MNMVRAERLYRTLLDMKIVNILKQIFTSADETVHAYIHTTICRLVMSESSNHKRILQDGGHEILVNALIKNYKHLYSEALHAFGLLNQIEYGRRKLADCIEVLSKLDGSEEEMICKI